MNSHFYSLSVGLFPDPCIIYKVIKGTMPYILSNLQGWGCLWTVKKAGILTQNSWLQCFNTQLKPEARGWAWARKGECHDMSLSKIISEATNIVSQLAQISFIAIASIIVCISTWSVIHTNFECFLLENPKYPQNFYKSQWKSEAELYKILQNFCIHFTKHGQSH